MIKSLFTSNSQMADSDSVSSSLSISLRIPVKSLSPRRICNSNKKVVMISIFDQFFNVYCTSGTMRKQQMKTLMKRLTQKTQRRKMK